MDSFLLFKWLHIISSVALVGIGFGSAFYLYFTNRSRNMAAVAEVSRLVVRADYWFTTPAIVIQPVTGVMLASAGGYSLTETWLLITYTLFVLAGICWLPVVWLQIRMRDMASEAVENNNELPSIYWLYAKWWTILGMVAFPAMLAVFVLMVFRPTEIGGL